MTNLVCGLLAVGLVDPASIGRRRGLGRPGAVLVLRGRQPKGDPLPQVHPPRPPGATASHGGRSPVLAERGEQHPGSRGGGRRAAPAAGKGDGVMATRPFAAGETVMVSFLVGELTGNDSHSTQVGPGRWALHGGLGPSKPLLRPQLRLSVLTTGRPSTSSPASRSAPGRS